MLFTLLLSVVNSKVDSLEDKVYGLPPTMDHVIEFFEIVQQFEV